MPKMNGGRAIVQALKANGADAVFGIPGVHNIYIYDALLDSGIRHFVTRHEQGAGFMADGYARASGRPGVCLPITGPGLTNISTPIAQAWTDSSPVLVISSQVERNICDRCKGTLHELRNQMAYVSQITEWTVRATSPSDCVLQVNRAYEWLGTRRPRPVNIEVPMDVQAEEAEVEIPEAPAQRTPVVVPGADDIERAADLLRGKRRPVIYAGGGAIASNASEEVLRLSTLLGAPVLTTCQGKGIVPEDHPAVIGSLATEPRVEEFLSTCDATVAVGTHFGASDTQNWRLKLPKPLIHIDIDSSEFCKNYEADVTIQSDARLALKALIDALGTAQPGSSFDEAAALRAACLQQARKRLPWEFEHFDVLRQALGRDGILVCDMVTLCYPATRYYPVYEPRTFMFPRGFGTLGFSPPVAMGAKIARPDRKVVAVVGDGGFMFTCQELATAVQYSIPVVIVIVNSNSYETVKRNQVQRFGAARAIDVDLKNPDFMKFAEAFGVWAARANDVHAFEKILGEALSADGPAIIEIPHAPR